MKPLILNGKKIGDGFPCYTIAEIGGLFTNFTEAKRLIDSAKEIGLDSVKFQTLEAETITTKNNFFNMEATGHVSQYDVFKQFELSKELQFEVVNYANKIGITIFSAPSHIKDLEIMKEMKLPIFKIGSDLACHVPLLKEVAKLDKPIILSTGMCNLDEVRESVDAIISTGNEKLALLHCVSDYPTKPEETNLNAIISLKKEFDIPVGLSDHNIGSTIALGAASIGANIIEKHFNSSLNSPSPDDIVALDKEQYFELIQSIRLIEKAKGSGTKLPTESEKKNLQTNRVSIVTLKEIKSGQKITRELIDIRRPGTGLKPSLIEQIIGKTAKVDIPAEEPLKFEMLE
ncbi:N-acetylneuraminate synthase family protein [Nitrosopumilus sp.]|uniref:N-acetylneuraminate synthase family protein n=1 Tax=Nitrosopumilus sp. TaxID=2024843 RepID=UPI00261A810A|nr:N-acetylneuraminate synthase family protein [Nitrosopumilus sp.]